MQDQEIDLKELWQIIDDNKKTIAKVTAGFLAVAAAYLIVVPPTYQSTSLLRIKQDKGLSSSILSALPTGSDQMIKQEMNTDAEILKSRNVVIPVIKQTEELKDGKYPDYEGYVKGRITTKPYKALQGYPDTGSRCDRQDTGKSTGSQFPSGERIPEPFDRALPC